VSSIVLLVAIATAAVSVVSTVGAVLVKAAMYDDSPAIVVRNGRLLSTVLKPGDPIRQVFEYDKRADCHPPGGSSEIAYRIWRFPVSGEAYYDWLDYNRPSRAEPGRNMSTVDSPSVVPLPNLAPGNYAFQWRAVYRCARASATQTIDGPMLPFAVVQ